MSQPCNKCANPGESCGTSSVEVFSTPCVVCGDPTVVRSKCGAARTFICTPTHTGDRTVPFTTSPPGVRPVTTVWLGATELQRRQTPARPAGRPGPVQPILRDELAEVLPGDQLSAAVGLWNTHMRGITYSGAHRTALAILNGTFRHHSIPAVPPYDPAWLAPLEDGPRWGSRAWNVYPGSGVVSGHREGYDLASYDVNGMFLSAADTDHGTGAPTLLGWPKDDVLRLPGYVRVSTLENAPWSIGDQWEELMWVPTPIAAYLRGAGAQFLIAQALVWPRYRRWFTPHVNLFRPARAALIADGGPAALAVLDIVKGVYTRALGGLVRSAKHNEAGDGFNVLWADTIPATGQARMWRNVDKAVGSTLALAGAPVRVCGFHVDAVWFVMPNAFTDPPRLEISTQLGKFKRVMRTRWTPELHGAYVDGDHETLRVALHDAR